MLMHARVAEHGTAASWTSHEILVTPGFLPERRGNQSRMAIGVRRMAAVKLDDLLIKSLKRRAVDEGRRIELRDTIVRGLAIRVAASGELTWTFMFRLKGTRRLRRITLGNYSHLGLGQARAAAKDMLSEVRLGSDPQTKIRERAEGERRPKQLTFGDLYHFWLERYAKPNLRAWRAEEGRYRRNLEVPLGRWPMAELDRKSFASIKNEVARNLGRWN